MSSTLDPNKYMPFLRTLWQDVAAGHDLSDEQANEVLVGSMQALATFNEVDANFRDGKTVTCRNCDTDLPSTTPCPFDEDSQHEPDQALFDPPPVHPSKTIRVAFDVVVPNDGYDYFVDVAGRIEQMQQLLLLHPGVTSVATGGPSGSGFIPVEAERS